MRHSIPGGAMVLWGLLSCAGRPATTEDYSTIGVVSVDLERQVDDRLACGSCHAAIVQQWAASEHASAYSDPVFQAGYAVDHRPECRRCHAPLADEGRDPPPDSIAAAVGVACRTCHASSGAIAGPPGPRAHGGPVQPGWGTSDVCRSCHQFTFAAGRDARPTVFDPREWMQRTYAEWEASGSPHSCQDCHMPWQTDARGRRYRSHRVLGIHDGAAAEAITVTLDAAIVEPATDRSTERTEGPPGVDRPTETAKAQQGGDLPTATTVATVQVAVDPSRLGHAFPTGDMFRIARLEVWPSDDATQVQVMRMRRRFGLVARPDDRGVTRLRVAEVADTRPSPGHPARIEFRWTGRHSTLEWRLLHLRMDEERAAAEGLAASLNRRMVAEGTIRVGRKAQSSPR